MCGHAVFGRGHAEFRESGVPDAPGRRGSAERPRATSFPCHRGVPSTRTRPGSSSSVTDKHPPKGEWAGPRVPTPRTSEKRSVQPEATLVFVTFDAAVISGRGKGGRSVARRPVDTSPGSPATPRLPHRCLRLSPEQFEDVCVRQGPPFSPRHLEGCFPRRSTSPPHDCSSAEARRSTLMTQHHPTPRPNSCFNSGSSWPNPQSLVYFSWPWVQSGITNCTSFRAS